MPDFVLYVYVCVHVCVCAVQVLYSLHKCSYYLVVCMSNRKKAFLLTLRVEGSECKHGEQRKLQSTVSAGIFVHATWIDERDNHKKSQF